MAKGGLGKGLGSLMADAAVESGSDTMTNELSLKDIVPNPNQPRSHFDEKGIEELADSIQQHGLLQPIIVRPNGKKYQIIAGERRFQACKKLNLKTVPVKIMDVDEVDTLKLALIENLQRTDLNPIEEAKGYMELLAASGMKQTELASAVSKSRSSVTNALRLLDLPEKVQQFISDGQLTSGHGRAILTLSDEEKRISLAEKAVKEQLSVRDTERLARLYEAGGSEPPRRIPTPRSYKKVAQQLRAQLDTNVRVKNTHGRNRIEIEFRDEEELQRIFELISGNASGNADGAAHTDSDR